MAQSPKAVCDQACTRLQACGGFVGTTCSSDCQAAGSTYVSCLAQAGLDCNQLALCFFTTACGGAGPSGTSTCAAAATCEGNCNVSNPGAACDCACIAQMSPEVAINLYINNSCAPVKCTSCQPATFNGADCNTCDTQMCSAQSQQCQSH